MSEPNQPPFLKFLEAGVAKGGFETDDVLAAVVPLMKQVLAAHEAGLVAPLDGVQDLVVTEEGQLRFAQAKVNSPEKNSSKVEAIQSPVSSAVEVVAESRRMADIDQGSLTVFDLGVGAAESSITKPVFLPNYRSWELAVGHHDELTDILSLGLLLASVACGLDFTDASELELFTVNRTNLFAISSRLNPVLASTIVHMTELNRHKRAQDLSQMISRLENYREQTVDFDTNVFTKKEFKESPITGKRRLIQSHLRDRLFEISRRNRLIYFKPTLQTLNLTIASVPVLLDYRNIKLEQLFVWHRDLAATVTEGAPMSLGRYLRFEDAPYIPGVLDKIVSEARRDRAEYGFAQLRLVLCFLRWNNLKEDKHERIHSPLLLLPCELTKKKGVRDNYVLDPTTSEAEVNPALRHHLKELYNLSLPEFVDLKETSLDQFYEALKAQIQASEPGVTFNKIDRPQIELVHEKARQRVDQYRRRLKLQARKACGTAKPDYSYDRENLKPLGLQIFLEKVRPTPMPLRDVAGAPPQPRLPHIVDSGVPADAGKVLETERQMFALRDGDNQNPYSWDFDLCSLTLGNFNYRKMTLMRDYAKLIETDMASGAFDRVFSLTPKPPEEAQAPALELADQHLVISCDATQASAIARARTGASYIIQGPPGTGKSQTITNLIADYVARGKRVLFVCEKRAAIDVVFHRLRQQGLDELCCLIHDSQTDKKAFIQNLKQTYEKFLSQSDLDPDAERARGTTLKAMEQDLANLRRFSDVMRQVHAHTGVAVRSLLHRLVELRGRAAELAPEIEDLLPEYPLWLQHGDVIGRLQSALTDLGEELCFAKHPLRWLGKGVLQADRPLEALSKHLDEAEDLLDAIESALELSGLPGELWDTFEEIQTILEFSVRVRPLAERNLVGVLTHGPAEATFTALATELDKKAKALQKAHDKTAAWRELLSPDDTESALIQAQSFEKSIFRFFQPAFWRLKKTLQARYDFAQHAVAPAWSKVLGDLAVRHKSDAEWEAVRQQASTDWRVEDVDAFRSQVEALQSDQSLSHPSVKALLKVLAESADAGTLIENLSGIHDRFSALDSTLSAVLAEYEQFEFPELAEVLAKLREQTGTLAELSPILAEAAELPDSFTHALRHAPVPLNEFEAVVGHKSINCVYRADRAVNRFEGRTLIRKMEQLEKRYREWLGLNARCIRMAVRQKLLERVNISSLPAAQLNQEQKVFKKSYAAGRRELEHEFGKTMRYKSIRDLAAGDTGQVIQDLKPIWLMSPLSVSDTLPLDPDLFDVVIFDEASQIPMEEAIPAIYRSHQAIVVGDEMQLPPTTFFASARTEDESVIVEEEGERIEVDLDSDSFLTQSAQNLPSTLLAWHYRSRYESLISFSNAAFYSGNLYTIPDRQRAIADRPELIVTTAEQGSTNVDALLARSISFHFMENGLYEDRRNPNEAAYIAQLVRSILQRDTKLSIGLVAFSEAQQGELENALSRLAEEDAGFAAQLETEYVREENDVFCGLFVKNLENVQGDERDIIIMSVCYGHDANGRMLMNFGPINQRGGEKRLNVIFSRAKHHMAIVSSIRHHDITNDYNDGANSLKNFLHYAEAVSKGDESAARRVLENLNPLSRKALAPLSKGDAVVEKLAAALRERGYEVDLNVGQSKFRCDLAVRGNADSLYQLGILVDTDWHYSNPNLLDRYLMQPTTLRAFGWRFALVLTKDWYHTPDDVLARIEKLLQGQDSDEEVTADGDEPEDTPAPVAADPDATVVHPPALPSPPVSPPGVKATPTINPEAGSVRRFEFVGGSSKKFWEISVSGNSFTVRFGRIGTLGQSQTKTFADEAKATHEAETLIAEKTKKGYVEKDD
ncbi:MAG TPA: WGR domain-containing protein [Verrucomicrobiota bacterium]|nr:WGR domain-containing protein [Verrucomicrobiota bacterium]